MRAVPRPPAHLRPTDSLLGAGPRVSPPRRTSADRDNSNPSAPSFARDAKEGDLIFNDTTKGPQFRGTNAWIPFGRVGSVDTTTAGSGTIVPLGRVEPGIYRISIYVIRSGGSGSPTVNLEWWDGTMNGPAKVIRVEPFVFPSGQDYGKVETSIYCAGDVIAYSVVFSGSLTFDTHIRAEAI